MCICRATKWRREQTLLLQQHDSVDFGALLPLRRKYIKERKKEGRGKVGLGLGCGGQKEESNLASSSSAKRQCLGLRRAACTEARREARKQRKRRPLFSRRRNDGLDF